MIVSHHHAIVELVSMEITLLRVNVNLVILVNYVTNKSMNARVIVSRTYDKRIDFQLSKKKNVNIYLQHV